jgi:para-aminobenzoate synthetase/4-amino-4-deoxychorismate lyase
MPIKGEPQPERVPQNTNADVADVDAAAYPPFELLETLLLEQGVYSLLERHIDRLTASAQYFGIPLDLAAARSALGEQCKQFPHEARRVRLLVAQDGSIRVESAALSPSPPQPLLVTLARTPVSRDDRFLLHKTTHRLVYEQHRKQHPDMFDVLLWNEQGELTEFTIGNLVLAQGDARWTPSRESGLLAGTFRAELLAQGAIHERVLTVSDLLSYDQIWLINSVRGWTPVQLAHNPA